MRAASTLTVAVGRIAGQERARRARGLADHASLHGVERLRLCALVRALAASGLHGLRRRRRARARRRGRTRRRRGGIDAGAALVVVLAARRQRARAGQRGDHGGQGRGRSLGDQPQAIPARRVTQRVQDQPATGGFCTRALCPGSGNVDARRETDVLDTRAEPLRRAERRHRVALAAHRGGGAAASSDSWSAKTT